MISFSDVSFCYGEECPGDNAQIRRMTLNIQKGECALLCGKSGAGKSTVLRLINGLAPNFYEGALQGKVLVDGRNPSSTPPVERVRMFGVVFQDPRSQFFMNSVQDEIAFSAENIGLAPALIREKVRESAALLGAEHLLERTVDALSAGQKQRVAIAAAVVLSPKVLILDEPISNLDADGIRAFIDILKKIKKCGTTIVISEHRLHSFVSIADTFLHIEDGALAHRWTTADFCGMPNDEMKRFDFRYPGMTQLNIHTKKTIVGGVPLLNVSDVSYLYGKTKCGIEHISLKLVRGSVIALLGENGAGKTTLCKVLCGLLRQKSGTVTRDDHSVSCAQRRRMSCFVMQDADYQLYSDSVANELLLGRKASQRTKERAREALELFGLQKVRERHPASLSGGEKQRVVIAAAYCSNAELFVFDEPTSGMDGAGLLAMARWTDMLAQTGKTVIIITHDELLTELACDYTVQLNSTAADSIES